MKTNHLSKNTTVTPKNTPSLQEEEERKRTMFYSQLMLSSKGPLGAIWVAGYFFKRLKKRQVTDTDIPSSVDKILLEGLDSVTYRILAYLLLGVVRIYSKKVEYLIQDCHETVSDINRFTVGKKVVPFRDIVRSTHYISLPERYELDAFQLEVADDAKRDHISRKEDIVLQDSGKDVSDQYCLDEHRFEEASPLWEELDDARKSVAVMMQQETCSSTQTPDKLAADRGHSTFAHTPPDGVLSPHQMEIDVEVSSPDQVKNFERSKEKLRELRFTQDETLDIDMICELDVELLNLVNDYKAQNTDGNEEALWNEPVENHDPVILKDKELPSPPEKTHASEVRDPAAAATPEFLLVPTPAKKENIQRPPSKRKCIFDMTSVLDNELMKQSIKDASSLVCKRRKAPHTVIDIWRFHRIPLLSKNLLEPLIPCAAMRLAYTHCGKKTERIDQPLHEATEPILNEAIEPVETTQASEKPEVAVSPRTPVDSRSEIAPGTPVRCSTSARVFGSPRAADSDGEGAHFYQKLRKEVSVQEEEEPGPSLMDEMDANEGDSQGLQKNKSGFSARTRTVARYLHGVIQKKKQKGEEAVKFLPIVKRKTRSESARFFYEILVLSSGGLMNVRQQKAYEDMLLQETPQMEATLQNC